MSDLTILLYTANRLPEAAAARLRAHLRFQVAGYNDNKLLCVSQQPIHNFGCNWVTGNIGANKYNAYWQIYLGVQYVTTEYVATVDDDTLYAPEHFDHRPPAGTFWYETNYWFCQDGKDHYWRPQAEKRGGMWGCIARTETLLDNLAARFERFPADPWRAGATEPPPPFWGEPGIRDGDKCYGRRDRLVRGASERPCVVFVHQAAMGYTQFSRWHRRYGQPGPEDVAATLDGYGTVAELRARYWEGDKVTA